MEFNSKINQALGAAAGFRGIPGTQIIYFLGIIICAFPLALFTSYLTYIIVVAIVFIVWLIYSGDQPGRAWTNLFYKSKRMAWQWLGFNENESLVCGPDIPKVKFIVRKGKRINWVSAFYETFKVPLEYEINGVIAGAYLHRKGTKGMVIFGWRCRGNDPLATDAMILRKLQGRLNGIKSSPLDIDLKVVNSSFKGDDGAIQQLLDRSKRDLTALERLILGAKIGRIRELCSDSQSSSTGIMQSDTLLIYAKYRFDFNSGDVKEPSQLQKFVLSVVDAFSFGMKPPNRDDWDRVTKMAWDNCFAPMQDILSAPNNCDFAAEPLTPQELWEEDYFALRERRDFYAEENGNYGARREAPLVPQYLPVTKNGIHDVCYNDGQHTLGSMYAPDHLPVTAEHQGFFMYSPALGESGKCIGYMALGAGRKVESFPSINGSELLGSYLFLYNALKEAGEPFTDYKIYWEWSPQEPFTQIVNMERRIAGAIQRQTEAHTKRKTIDVLATIDLDQSKEAREMLADRDLPGWLSLVIAVYRNTPDELAVAMGELKRRFLSSHPLVIEGDCDAIWRQCPAYAWDMLLTKPGMMAQQYFASEAFRMMPCVSAPRLDKSGILMLHQKFRSPIYLDIVHKKPNHTAIIAETGQGKSIFLLEFICEYLNYNFPGIVFEFPRSDGRSTYTDFMFYLELCGKKVAYINIKKESYNFLERPSFKHLNLSDPIQRLKLKEALEDIEHQQADLLCTLVIGVNPGSDEEDIKSWIITSFHAWLELPDVIEDYKIACNSSFGEEDFLKMPNLPRYIGFAIPWLKDKLRSDETIYDGSKKAIDKICRSFEKLLSTQLGKSLSGPSTFDLSSDFIVLCLTDISSNYDSLIYALVGLQIITHKSASSQSSGAIVEEATTLLNMPPFARQVERIPVVGRKQGMNVVFAFQLLGNVSENLFGNIQNVILGGTTEITVKQLNRLTGFDPEIGALCVSNKTDKKKMESYFIVKRGTTYVPVTHFPSKLLLSLGATDVEEVDARHRCLKKYGNPDDPTDFQWLLTFSDLYHQTLQSGKSMNTICPEVICV